MAKMASSHIRSPGPAEILRSAQKDNDFIQRIRTELDELVQETLGQRFWQKWRIWIEHSAKLIYYSLTNLAGFQTLGEEYAGIVQVDRTLRQLPSRFSIAMMTFTQIFGDLLIQFFIKKLGIGLLIEIPEAEVNTLYIQNPKYRIIQFGSKLLEILSFCLPLILQFHLTLFFFSGKFYHISKRLTGIQYILVRKFYANTRQDVNYLIWLSVFNLALTALHECKSFIAAQLKTPCIHIVPSTNSNVFSKKNVSNVEMREEDNAGKKCSLCLEVRRHPSVTPCGHLFCWDCILDSLRSKEECPICRDSVTPSRVVPLQNYV